MYYTLATVTHVNHGYQYFKASPYNGPGGGIRVHGPLTAQSACLYATWEKDTFSIDKELSHFVALFPFGFAVHDNPRDTVRRPINLPHWHAEKLIIVNGRIEYDRLVGHHWYRNW
jgi:hypothetical protein